MATRKGTDGSGNLYIEVDLPHINQAVRVSFIKEGWDGSKCIRINLRDEKNHIRPGAEFPNEISDEIIDAIDELSKL
jgi:hypothetical protein